MSNPFELVTASKLSAEKAVALWYDDKRLDRVKGPESCFINGHRGTGKTMLFRILQLDCQQLIDPSSEPDFLAVYFSVRDSEFLAEEMTLFQDDSQRSIIGESHFAILLLKQLFILLEQNPGVVPATAHAEFVSLVQAQMTAAFQFADDEATDVGSSLQECLAVVLETLERERIRLVNYLGLRLYARIGFDGPLFLLDTLLAPVADFLHKQAGKAIYVLIDDGDDLPESHTVVLNTWIARRRASLVFKVSTMFGYRTYRTRGGSAIQHPHDFMQYDIATRYLSDPSEDYIHLVEGICRKRLTVAGIEVEPRDFFPEDIAQRGRLDELAGTLRGEYEGKHTGRAARDYVYRHLSSEYIKRELATGRSTHTYSYSGFETIATLSSGLVRDFIICAQQMFDDAPRGADEVLAIPPSIQNAVVRAHADEVLQDILKADQKRALSSSRDDWRKVHRLIEGLANIFKQKMLSNDAERRVFSFAFQTEPSEEIERIVDLALAEGYLMKGFISRKEGTGRRVLYVLTRRLAPAFNLDVSSYAGYLSLEPERVRKLIERGPEDRPTDPDSQLSLLPETEVLLNPRAGDADQEGDWVPISPDEAGH